MAILKFANAVVVDLISMQAWKKMQGPQAFRIKTAAADKLAAEQSKYLLSHATIMASVMTEDEPFDYLIKPESSIYVNNNQDAWENAVLKLSYRSFVGAFNFEEHKQVAKLNKGHILDSVLRKVHLTGDVWVYYCDILVATDLKHESLVSDIRSEKTKYMSMGCLTEVVICSFCGARCTDMANYCSHLLYRKGEYLHDDEGVPRRVSELCGHKSLPGGGVNFVESSWVKTPACPAAMVRTVVPEEWLGPKTPFTHLAAGKGKAKTASSAPTDFRQKAKAAAEFRRVVG